MEDHYKVLVLDFNQQVDFLLRMRKKNLQLGDLARATHIDMQKLATWIQADKPVVLGKEWDKVQQKLDQMLPQKRRPRTKGEEAAMFPRHHHLNRSKKNGTTHTPD